MTVPPRERKTTSGWFAIVTQVIGFLLISLAMFSRSWLQAEGKAYGTALDSLGLWWQCFRSFTVNKDIHNQRFFVGCRWIFDRFTTGYEDVREMLATPFFVFVQIFFTICFVLAMLGFILSCTLVLCPGEKFEILVLRLSFIFNAIAFVNGFLAVAIFGGMAPQQGWMPHAEHNLLSWSYAVGTVGVVAIFAATILYWVEYRIQQRKESYRKSHGGVPLETKA